MRGLIILLTLAVAALSGAAVQAAPTPTSGDYVLKAFRFKSGETLPDLRLHYRTLGHPRRDQDGKVVNAVLLLHGTGGSGAQFLQPQFADELFGPGQPLDVERYYVIMPDGVGHGGSSKPSDGLRMAFPKYVYDDMARADVELLTKGLGVNHLKLVLGTSMGCMHAFVLGEAYPDFMDALAPFACLPVPLAGRNRVWRQMTIDAIKLDPAWKAGDYVNEPVVGLRTVADLLLIAGSAPLPWQKAYPTRSAAEAFERAAVDKSLAGLDANDFIYQVDASREYDPSAGLEQIKAKVLWINSADDFINPPELRIAEAMAPRLKNGRFILLPATEATHGHGSHTWATLWKGELNALIESLR